EREGLHLFDGASGARAWASEIPFTASPLPSVSIPFVPPARPPPADCRAVPSTPRYDAQIVCESVVEDDARVQPLALRATPDGVAYAFNLGGLARVALVDAEGTFRWSPAVDGASVPTALDVGAWIAGDAVLAGHDDGLVQARDGRTGTVLLSQKVSDFVGRFGFLMHVPEGGFYGTHLLVATLSWTDGASVARSARLLDWFEVVGADGKPVARPAYEVILVVQDRGNPTG
ncbi:MAG TPA: hypothetical protein VHH36_09985, partial [Candidatus Thermoplasmatota archaeon]|nr:hypothetical protein [Candidatus Thermoplasmatota archaeon]